MEEAKVGVHECCSLSMQRFWTGAALEMVQLRCDSLLQQ